MVTNAMQTYTNDLIKSMLQSPVRIFRCYICVEHRLVAPLQDLSLLIEHLAKHLDFHLYECRGCELKFVTPFIANFHIKEGKCKKEEGELCDDGGPPLRVVDLDTVDFAIFCQLQNAITKCTELMLYELNYGEEDLLNCLVFSKEPAMCPVSPDPIIRRERQMQTSPPPPQVRPSSRPGSSDTPLTQPAAANRESEERDLADGYSLVSDEELEPSKLPRSSNIEVDDGLSLISNSPSSSVAAPSPHRSSPSSSSATSPPPPSQSPSSTDPVPSFMNLKVQEIFGEDLPPRMDRRQQVVMPERIYAPNTAVCVEADSSSMTTSAPAPFYFQAAPAISSRSQPNLGPPPYEPVYPTIAPVYSTDMRINHGAPMQGFPYCSGNGPAYAADAMPSHQQRSNVFDGMLPPANAEVSSSTMYAPPHDQRRPPNNLPAHHRYRERLLTPEQDFAVDGNRCSGDRLYGREYFSPRDEDGSGTLRERIYNNEWVGCEEDGHPIEPHIRFDGMDGPSGSHPTEPRIRLNTETDCCCENVFVCRHGGEKQRHSYGIAVVHRVDPHQLASEILKRRIDNNERRSRAMPRQRPTRGRSRTVGAPRAGLSRSRSLRFRELKLTKEKPPSSTARRSNSSERTPSSSRHRKESPVRYEIFPASILDGDDSPRRSDKSKGRYRSRSQRRRASDSEDESEGTEDSRKRQRKSGDDEEEDESYEKAANTDVVIKTESHEDQEMLEVIERMKARTSRLKESRSRFSQWRKSQSKRLLLRSPEKAPRK